MEKWLKKFKEVGKDEEEWAGDILIEKTVIDSDMKRCPVANTNWYADGSRSLWYALT